MSISLTIKTILSISVVVVPLLLTSCAKLVEPDIDRPVKDQDIMQELRMLSGRPLAVSPDEERLLWSMPAREQPFGLGVRSVANPTKQGPLQVSSAQPLLRASWRPDGRMIAFFRQEVSALRQLVFWDLETGFSTDISTPKTSNQYQVEWSPDGERFAYTSDGRELVMVGVDKSVRRFKGRFRSFSFNATSDKVAAIEEVGDWGVAVQIFDLDGRIKETKFCMESPWDLVNVGWAPFPEMLVRAQIKEKQKTVSRITTVNPETLKPVHSFDIDGEASWPERFADGSSVLWTSRGRSGFREVVKSSIDGRELGRYNLEGHASLLRIRGEKAYLTLMSPAVNQIVDVSLNGPRLKLSVVAEVSALAVSEVVHENIELPVQNNHSAAIIVSRLAKRNGKRSAAVVRMLGGKTPEFAANWAERQLYLRHGVDYVTVANIKPHSVNDLLAACRYIKTELGIPSDRIVVYGASTAATVALEAAMNEPTAMGVLLLVGLGQEPNRAPVSGLPGVKIFAFHGASDPFIPTFGKGILDASIGSQASLPPFGFWAEIKGEAHAFFAGEGIVHGTILHHLGNAGQTSKPPLNGYDPET